MGTVHLQDLLGKSGAGDSVPVGPVYIADAFQEKKLLGNAIFKVNFGPAIE